MVPQFLECTGLLQNLSQRNHPLESCNQSRLDALNNRRESSYDNCFLSEKVYLSQTKRQFCTRLKEHQRAVSNFNSSKSALAEHVCETSHNIAWEDSRIITTNNRYGQRLCLEAWHINASPCALNRDDGSHLPQEYLHLVGR